MASQKYTPARTLSASNNIITTSSNTTPKSTTVAMNKIYQQPQKQQQEQLPPYLQQPQLGVSYMLYLHREELRKRKSSCMRISRTKFQLTHELITKTVKNIHKCSPDDLQILSRETIFKKNLRRQIARMKYHQLLQNAKYQKQQNDRFLQQQEKAHKEHLKLQQKQSQFLPQEHHRHQQHQSGGVTAMEGIEISC
ncbi:uncharacterized protein LOC111687570 [Lucilia cuprina]|uniref:uncharacterized protein LOC111687570 n=1 Tax=Lucilia cuprina TaxID=7375 RepID=UPI001F0684AA|nr:uncharacterized protein LOC111687570 [Lucilia cuprina]